MILIYFECTRFKNSSRVLGSSRKTPNIVLVTVLLWTFCTPRITIHWNKSSGKKKIFWTVHNYTATIIMANKRLELNVKHFNASNQEFQSFADDLLPYEHLNRKKRRKRTKSLLVMSLLYLNGCSTCLKWFLWLFEFDGIEMNTLKKYRSSSSRKDVRIYLQWSRQHPMVAQPELQRQQSASLISLELAGGERIFPQF